MRILMDNGIYIHSEFAEGAIKQTSECWGGTLIPPVRGVIRKAPDKNADYQKQQETLFTVGRLIREGRIEAFDYWEIQCERWRGTPEIQGFNALRGCDIRSCDPAIQRSKFRQTIDLTDVFSKGGRKDNKNGIELGQANQLAFLEWLCALDNKKIDSILSHAPLLGLTSFEVDSFKDIEYFQFFCERSGSRENYADVFHLWTAKRNGLDAFLTLETVLPNLVSRVKNEKVKGIEIGVEVLRPLDLLKKLGIEKPDPVPMDLDRFYHLHELPD